jgi:hypothetical protein
MKKATVAVLALCLVALAQQKEPSVELQLRMVKTQRLIQKINLDQQAVQQKYQQLQADAVKKLNESSEVKKLSDEANKNVERLKTINQEFQAEKDQAYKDLGLKPEEWELDEDNLVFVKKAAKK